MDVSVDAIIERVLIRNTSQHYDYGQAKSQVTSTEHLWHFQLQEQKLALQERLRRLRVEITKKEEQTKKEDDIKRNIEELKKKIEQIVDQNAKIQKQLSRIRIRNQKDMSGEVSNDLSRSRRDCSCDMNKKSNDGEFKQKETSRNKGVESKLVTSMESPIKSILKAANKDAAINCELASNNMSSAILQKKKHTQTLKSIISHQEQLISSYERELNFKNVREPKTALPYQLQRPTSVKTFKPISSVGSIVKIKRN